MEHLEGCAVSNALLVSPRFVLFVHTFSTFTARGAQHHLYLVRAGLRRPFRSACLRVPLIGATRSRCYFEDQGRGELPKCDTLLCNCKTQVELGSARASACSLASGQTPHGGHWRVRRRAEVILFLCGALDVSGALGGQCWSGVACTCAPREIVKRGCPT